MAMARNLDVARPAAGQSAPKGVTLIELMVVLTIVLMISAVAAQAVVPALTGRQIREAARMVNTMINSARNRAIQTGRPAGIWIQRDVGRPGTSGSISYAQVPDPYTGEFTDSGLEAYVFPNWFDLATRRSTQYFLNIVRPSSSLGRDQDVWWTADPTKQKFIKPGDQLKVNYQSVKYTLESSDNLYPYGCRYVRNPYASGNLPGGPYFIIAIGINKTIGATGYSGSRDTDYRYDINWYTSMGYISYPYISPGSNINPPYGRAVPYQMLRQPVRSAAGTLRLPDAVCIDLNFSGDANRNFNPHFVPGDKNNPPNPYYGYEIDITGNPLTAQSSKNVPDTTPIIIMFDASGAVERVYSRNWNLDTRIYEWKAAQAFTPIHLLIGRTDRVSVDTPFSASDGAFEDPPACNWIDAESLWVSVNPQTGLVTTIENTPPYNSGRAVNDTELWAGPYAPKGRGDYLNTSGSNGARYLVYKAQSMAGK